MLSTFVYYSYCDFGLLRLYNISRASALLVLSVVYLQNASQIRKSIHGPSPYSIYLKQLSVAFPISPSHDGKHVELDSHGTDGQVAY